jgi:hypothetical protein
MTVKIYRSAPGESSPVQLEFFFAENPVQKKMSEERIDRKDAKLEAHFDETADLLRKPVPKGLPWFLLIVSLDFG